MANRNQRPDSIHNRRQREPNENRTPRYAPGSYPGESQRRGNYRGQFESYHDDHYSGPQYSGHEPYGSQWQQHGHYQDSNAGRQQRYQNQQQFENDQGYDAYRAQHSYRGYRQEENEYPENRNTGRRSSYGYRETPYRQYGQSMHDYRDQETRRDDDRNWWDRTRDEVSSWFGDEDAQHRKSQDLRQDNGIYKGVGPKGYHRSDERIKDDINDRLSDDPYIDASDVEVLVENGEVTLSGTVMNKEIKRRAEDIAESVSAVSNVENRIRISPFSKEGQRMDRNERKEESETSQQRLQKKG